MLGAMSGRVERLPLVGLLPLLTALALLSTAGPDHLLLALAVAGLGALAVTGVPTVAPELVAVRRHHEVCRSSGVRSTDPDRPGRVRPRAPGLP